MAKRQLRESVDRRRSDDAGSIESTIDFSRTKAVIWDLDNTYWRGTLSEGMIEAIPDHHNAVVRLAQEGIICSLCSNNDHDTAREALMRQGVWDQFVFPAISWGTKPQMIMSTINSLQLLAQNVAVIDDCARLRAQIRSAVPGLGAVVSPEEFGTAFRVAFPNDRPLRDPRRRRLDQYKLLERRASAKADYGQASTESVEAFLNDSSICCRIFSPDPDDMERLHDLLTRANQLNFTRSRLSIDALRALLEDSATRCYGVQVEDRFGDYGLCGFVALDCNGRLIQFVFSCRILQMGIEDALYKHFGRPTVVVSAGEPPAHARGLEARSLDAYWVRIETGQSAPSATRIRPPERPTGGSAVVPLRLSLIGDCGVSTVSGRLWTLASAGDAVDASWRVTTFGKRGHRDFWAHRSVMEGWLGGEGQHAWRRVISQVTWLCADLVKPPEHAMDVYILGLMNDYTSAEYEHTDTGVIVPYYYFKVGGLDVTDSANWPMLLTRSRHFHPVDLATAQAFSQQFRFKGPATPESEVAYLERLRAALPSGSHLILINAAECIDWTVLDNTVDYVSLELMRQQAEHHRILNEAVDRFIARGKGVHLIDVRKHIRTARDGRDLMHPFRPALSGIANDLFECLIAINASRAADAESINKAQNILQSCLEGRIAGMGHRGALEARSIPGLDPRPATPLP